MPAEVKIMSAKALRRLSLCAKSIIPLTLPPPAGTARTPHPEKQRCHVGFVGVTSFVPSNFTPLFLYCFFIAFRLLCATHVSVIAAFSLLFRSELDMHFPGGESDMTLCRSTSKKRRKPQMEIRNKISNPSSIPASHWRYNLTVPGF